MSKRNFVIRGVEITVGVALVVFIALLLAGWSQANAAPAQQTGPLAPCAEAAFSTEQRFLSRGPRQPDGQPVVSGGDLLSPRGVVCMRNRELLAAFMPAGAP